MDSYFDLDKNLNILGNNNGEIFRITKNKRELLYTNKINSVVRAIRKIKEIHLIIAFYSGDIIILENYADNFSIKKIRNGDNSKYDRIYALQVFNSNTIYFSSNYGKIYKMVEHDDNWSSILIERFHGTNAIFCLEKLSENKFITCDFGGGIVIWEVNDKKEIICYKINTYGNIQCVACSKDMNRLAMVHRTGTFLIFQKYDDNYKIILEHEYPRNSGRKIVFLENDNSFVFNTTKNLYKYTEGVLYKSNLQFIGNIEKIEDKIYFLNSDDELECIDDKNFSPIVQLETSKLLNIGLIGHTGVGKSTLCDKFFNIEKESDLSSTSHRKLWIYKIEKEDKFIFFNDIAGQLELIPTLLPALKRSDIIFALFRSNDSLTFDILEKYIHLLRIQYKFFNRIFLIRTFYDEEDLDSSHSDLISMEKINNLIENYALEPLISVDRDNIESLRQFKKKFLDSIEWDEIKDWIISIQQKAIFSYLQFQLESNSPIKTLDEICNIYDEFSNETKKTLEEFGFYGIDRSVFRTLLLKLKEKDLIDVIELEDDLILILNSELFRNLKAKIYEIAKDNMGIVHVEKIILNLKDKIESYEDKHLFIKYLNYYNKEFLSSNTWLFNNKKERIFWSLIKNETFEINDLIKKLKELPNGVLEKFTINLNKFLTLSEKEGKLCNLELFLELLEKDLLAIKLSTTRGYWRNNEKTIILYYAFLDGEESTFVIYYIFSNSNTHETALSIDNFLREYFLNSENESSFYTRSAGIFIEKKMYESYKKIKRDFFNSHIGLKSIKYKTNLNLNNDKKILLLYTVPIDNDPIRSESEILKIKEFLEEIDYKRENYRILPHCSIDNLKIELENFIPDFIHYSGHSDENFVFFENNNGRTEKFDCLEFIKLIPNSSTEIFLNSCKSQYILEHKSRSNLKCIGYNRKVPDFQARSLGIHFFIFFIRYGSDFFESINRSKNYLEIQEKISIPYIYKSDF